MWLLEHKIYNNGETWSIHTLVIAIATVYRIMQIVRGGKLTRFLQISLQSQMFSSEKFYEYCCLPETVQLANNSIIEHMVEMFLGRCPTISSPALQTATAY